MSYVMRYAMSYAMRCAMNSVMNNTITSSIKKTLYFQLFVVSLFVLMVPVCLANATVYDATVHFANRVTLSVPVSGVIKSVNVTVGQRVQAEKILVELDQVPFVAAVAQAKAEVVISTTKQTEATRDYGQAQELYDRTVLSNVELENAKLKANRATAAFNAAQAYLALAKYNLAHSKVIAPFNGLVLKIHAIENENVNNAMTSQPLMVFAAEGHYLVKTYAPLKALASLAIGKKGKITIEKKQFSGTVISVALEPVNATLPASIDKQEAHYEVSVEFNSDNIVLRAGQTARVEFP